MHQVRLVCGIVVFLAWLWVLHQAFRWHYVAISMLEAVPAVDSLTLAAARYYEFLCVLGSLVLPVGWVALFIMSFVNIEES